jgi:pyruvate dehydrogenase E1 component alpha subunit
MIPPPDAPHPPRPGHGALPAPLDRERGHRLLWQMLRIRRLEERSAELYTQEKIRGFLHLYIGQEAVATGVIDELTAEDAVVGTYREHGHALVKGIPAGEIMAEMFGRQEGCSRGRGGSMHLFSREHRVYGGHGIVGAGIPMAVGLALADKLQGRPQVTACFFGEGAVAEGEFHESLNLAALWKVPVLFVCENNRYAMGTALERCAAQPDVHLRAASYNLPSVQVNGMDVLAVARATRKAVGGIRSGEGPHFIEALTYRFRAHSMFDPELYRERQEVEIWKDRCPIAHFDAHLRREGLLDADERAALEAEVEREMDDAVAFAEAGTLEPVEDLHRFVHSGEEERAAAAPAGGAA